jgi:hypothetical protein
LPAAPPPLAPPIPAPPSPQGNLPAYAASLRALPQAAPPPASGDIVRFAPNAGDALPAIPQARTVHVPASNTPLADPKLIAQIDANAQRQAGAVDQEADAARQVASAEAGVSSASAAGKEAEATELDRQAEEAKTAAAKREDLSRARLDQIDAASKNLADQKIDPDRYWSSRSTASKVSYGIAAILGGFLEGAKGGANSGIEMLNTAIDRDIAAQRQELETKKDRVADMNSLYARAYQATGDHEEADRLARGVLLEGMKAKTMALAETAGTPVALAKGDELSAKLQEEKEKVVRGGLEDDVKLHKYSPGGDVTVGGGAPVPKEDVARAVNVAGETYLAPDKEAAAKLRPEIAAYTNADRMLKRAQELRQDPNWSPFTPGNPQQRDLEDISARLPLAIHADGVRLQPEIISRLEQTTKNIASSRLNPGAWGIDAALAAHRRMLQDELATTLAAQPLEHVKRGVAANPTTGGIMRTQADTGRDFIPAKAGRGAPPPTFQSFGGGGSETPPASRPPPVPGLVSPGNIQARLYEGRR